MIRVTNEIGIAEWELSESFSRASGPGGQNDNKVETAVGVPASALQHPLTAPEILGMPFFQSAPILLPPDADCQNGNLGLCLRPVPAMRSLSGIPERALWIR
jgi:hypothetical protein